MSIEKGGGSDIQNTCRKQQAKNKQTKKNKNRKCS